jgi:hypothetical protein
LKVLLAIAALMIAPFNHARLPAQEPAPAGVAADQGAAAVQSLEGNLATTRQASEALTQRLTQLEIRLTDLLAQVAKATVPEPPPEPPPTKQRPRQVAFRPPFEKLAADKTTIGFVCESGKIAILDYTEINDAFQKIRERALREDVNREKQVVIDVEMPESDFHVVGGWWRPASDELHVPVRRKPGNHLGESPEEIESENSRFQRFLSSHSRNKHVLEFIVYPDSFEAFRAARALGWKLKYGLNWDLMESAKQIELGRGVGSTQ